MAKAGWVKSLHCKTNAIDDVIVFNSKQNKIKKLPQLPLPLQACANPSHTLRDVVVLFPQKPRPRRKPKPRTTSNTTTKHDSEAKKATLVLQQQLSPSTSPSTATQNDIQSIATLAELPAGNSSRRVVEIIFGSSWSKHGTPESFPGEIELLFRVHHPARAVARFEEYRTAVRARAAASEGARCAADGNETLRFHLAPTSSQHDSAGWVCAVLAHGKSRGIRTFSGSGGADESGGGGAGRRAMLVCRVIAGRVKNESDSNAPDTNYDSVSLGRGELLVFDSRAVLPCFLIIYNV